MRAHRFVSCFAAVLIGMAPMHALAQPADDDMSVRNRPRSEYDPAGAQLGAFKLDARLDLSVSSTDNLFAQETTEQDDVYLDVGPWARLASTWSRHAVGVEAGANFRSHDKISSEDSETGFLRGFGRLDIGGNTTVTAAAGFAQSIESRTDPDSPATPEPVEYDRNDAALIVQHTFNRFRVTGEVAQIEYDYSGLQNFRDNDVSVVRGRVEAEVTPRIGLLLQAEVDERDYDNAPALSSDGEIYLLGVTINLTDLMRGQIAVGHFERDYDSGVSTDGLAVSGNVEWYVTRLTTISFDAHRSSEDVIGGTQLSPYVENRYGVRVDHELRRNIILSAGVETGDRDYEAPIDREDEFTAVNAGFDILLNRRVALRGQVRHDDVESNGVDRYRDFEATTASFGVSLRL